ncbi:hypothetical protein J6590_044929 [Homalodisca vitripennis]|nr:hypothetical protein J6590_044929 [Homalodisca vitripennis]
MNDSDSKSPGLWRTAPLFLLDRPVFGNSVGFRFDNRTQRVDEPLPEIIHHPLTGFGVETLSNSRKKRARGSPSRGNEPMCACPTFIISRWRWRDGVWRTRDGGRQVTGGGGLHAAGLSGGYREPALFLEVTNKVEGLSKC